MSQGANVRSVQAIRDFKIALINFAEEANNALGSVEMEIRMVRNWLLRDQLSYWQSQVKRCQERLAMARADLNRRLLSQSSSGAVSDTEQKEALRDAQRKLREAEEKVIVIKKWAPILEHAISEYNSQSQPLGDRLSGRFVATLNVLDRMLDALDSYLAMAPPTAPVAPTLRAGDTETESELTSAAAGTDTETASTSDAGPPKPAGNPVSSHEMETEEYSIGGGSAADTSAETTAEFRVDPR